MYNNITYSKIINLYHCYNTPDKLNIQHHSVIVYTIQKHMIWIVTTLTNKNYIFCINLPTTCSNVFYVQIKMTCFGPCLVCEIETECINPLFIHTI
jgi:hypothetical protein